MCVCVLLKTQAFWDVMVCCWVSSSGISKDYSVLLLRVESGVSSLTCLTLKVKAECTRLGSSEVSVSVSAPLFILRYSFEEASVQLSASERANLRHRVGVALCILTFTRGWK